MFVCLAGVFFFVEGAIMADESSHVSREQYIFAPIQIHFFRFLYLGRGNELQNYIC